MDHRTSKIMWRVFQWAWKNGIDIELRAKYFADGYDTTKMPELVLRRRDKSICRMLSQINAVEPYISHCWKAIAADLCVEPLDLSDL